MALNADQDRKNLHSRSFIAAYQRYHKDELIEAARWVYSVIQGFSGSAPMQEDCESSLNYILLNRSNAFESMIRGKRHLHPDLKNSVAASLARVLLVDHWREISSP
jgi:hypothetical protein